MKSRKTTTRHYHLRQTKRSGKVPVRQHPMNYWGVTAIARGKRKRGLVSTPFTSSKRANSFRSGLLKENKHSKTGPLWGNPRVVKLKDSDLDGIPNRIDCKPLDPTKQEVGIALGKPIPLGRPGVSIKRPSLLVRAKEFIVGRGKAISKKISEAEEEYSRREVLRKQQEELGRPPPADDRRLRELEAEILRLEKELQDLREEEARGVPRRMIRKKKTADERRLEKLRVKVEEEMLKFKLAKIKTEEKEWVKTHKPK